jgi:hypothetical protein
MEEKVKNIDASKLTGPRSYFTDLDPKDKDYNEALVSRRLKLQLLTKKNVVIAASSLFHDVGMDLFRKNEGLSTALNQGIILPAIRDQFYDLDDFFSAKAEYSSDARDFFKDHVRYSVPWSLQDNSSWFKKSIYQALSEEKSILRQCTGLSSHDAASLIHTCEEILGKLPEADRFLSRDIIKLSMSGYRTEVKYYIENYVNLVYRLSGSRVVNSEGHFPQSNLTKAGLVGNDKLVSDDAIFWDIFVEAAASHLSTAVLLTIDRIDRLEYSDILKIRESFFQVGFVKKYDEVISLSKSEVSIEDPEKLILKAQEIAKTAKILREQFSENIAQEMKVSDNAKNEKSLFQIANTLALMEPTCGAVFGVLSSLKSIPEITAPISNELSTSIQQRMNWFREFVNNKLGWSTPQKTALIDAYRELVVYGL